MHSLSALLHSIWEPIRTFVTDRPWTAFFVLGGLSAICFALEVPYLRTALGVAAGAVLMAKAERDVRARKLAEAEAARASAV